MGNAIVLPRILHFITGGCDFDHRLDWETDLASAMLVSSPLKGGYLMSENTLTITDNRTHKTYTVPVENGTIRAMDLRQIKTGPDDFGLMT